MQALGEVTQAWGPIPALRSCHIYNSESSSVFYLCLIVTGGLTEQ